jgi:hypothetical protein
LLAAVAVVVALMLPTVQTAVAEQADCFIKHHAQLTQEHLQLT